MKDGTPLSTLEGHGYGTRGIASIAKWHGGQAIFSDEDGMFTLEIMLPFRNRGIYYLTINMKAYKNFAAMAGILEIQGRSDYFSPVFIFTP